MKVVVVLILHLSWDGTVANIVPSFTTLDELISPTTHATSPQRHKACSRVRQQLICD
jgi:hypothetical protein